MIYLTCIIDVIGLASNIVSVVTAVILAIWFFYSQRQQNSRNYYDEIPGLYAGFTDSMNKPNGNETIYSGVIMDIKTINSDGYFKGEFDFGEVRWRVLDNEVLIDGFHSFLGRLEYQFYYNKIRHPFKLKDNRTYIGKLYVVDRFDFSHDTNKIDDFVSDEYVIHHYREMQTLTFTLLRKHNGNSPQLPKYFTLYKSFGANFEPYKNLKETVFFHREMKY